MSSSRSLSLLLGCVFLFPPLFSLRRCSHARVKMRKRPWTQGIMSFGSPPRGWSQRPCHPYTIAVICLFMRDEEKMKEGEEKKRCSRVNAAKGAIFPPGVPPAFGLGCLCFTVFLIPVWLQFSAAPEWWIMEPLCVTQLALVFSRSLQVTPFLHPCLFFPAPHMREKIITHFQRSHCPLGDRELPLAGCTCIQQPVLKSIRTVLGCLKNIQYVWIYFIV